MRSRARSAALPLLTFAALAAMLPATACNALTGVSDLVTAPELGGVDGGGVDAAVDSSVRDASVPKENGYGISGWTYRRDIALTSDEAAPLSEHAVLVVVPGTFDYAHASPKGQDLRFTVDPLRKEELRYFIEDWTPAGESHVWVVVPTVPVGASSLHMFYGNAAASEASAFAGAFPKAVQTAGGGAGSFTATGDLDVDWFELREGDTLTLAAGAPLRIRARRIILAGIVQGTGLGHAGGPVPSGQGTGPGGGMVVGGSGAGGGGHGGAGGAGGADGGNNGGAGGAAYGTADLDDLAMGSGGGTMDGRPAGNGGGALTVAGWRTTVARGITMNGTAGGGLSGQNSGGGAGGGILVAGAWLDLAGATLAANGGVGGPCAQAANDGGGGGAGGRIKLRRRALGSFIAPASMTVAPGSGGAGSGTDAPGRTGTIGTTDVNQASTFVRGVDAVLGAELSAR